MPQNRTKNVVILGLLIGLVTVATMSIKVPVPATGGMIHVGDSLIFLAAILFGRKKGAIAGGLGGFLADILVGYGQWAIPTLIIKGLMGYTVGTIADGKGKQLINFRNIVAIIVGTLIMVTGYYIAGGFIIGFNVAIAGIPWDILQGIGGGVIFFPIGLVLKKNRTFQNFIDGP